MMRPFFRATLTALAAFFLIATAGTVWAQSQTLPVYYYRGDQKIEVHLDVTGILQVDPATGTETRITIPAPAAKADDFAKQLPAATAYAPAESLRPILYSTTTPLASDQPHGRLTNRFTVRVGEGETIRQLADKYEFRVVESINFSPNTYIAEPVSTAPLASLQTANRLYEEKKAVFSEPLIERQQQKRLVPNDALYPNQWHLKNTGAQVSPSAAGNDVNIEPAWDIVSGSGVNIAIADDGLEITHEDLAPNVRTDIDWDFNGNDNDPSPGSSNDWHGTGCAGVAAARGNNTIGVTGAAPRAGLVGLRLIAAPTTDQQEANSILHNYNDAISSNVVHINSNSWGPADVGVMADAGPLWKAAVAEATTNGRSGRGTLITWAGGNGANNNDNVNYDGYANSRHIIAVAASNAEGGKASYSEPGACLLVNAPSSHGSYGITTTDLIFWGSYWNSFGGTSSACPLVAGIVALMLEANPNLTWRDVMEILANTATKNEPGDPGWFLNGAGRNFNHKHGFGRANATAAVNAALTWVNVPAETTPLTASDNTSTPIPDNDPAGINIDLPIVAPPDFYAETAALRLDVTHTRRGNLTVTLTSPAGTVSELALTRTQDNNANITNWVYLTRAILGENPTGTWTLHVSDRDASNTGTFNEAELTVHGRIGAGGGGPPCVPSADVLPDLVPEVVLAVNRITGKAATPKHRLRGQVIVRNTGLLKSKKCRLSFYVSDDAVLDPATDTLLAKQFSIGAVKPGKEKKRRFNIKATTAEASHAYIFVVVDREDIIAEQAKCNNSAFRLVDTDDRTKP